MDLTQYYQTFTGGGAVPAEVTGIDVRYLGPVTTAETQAQSLVAWANRNAILLIAGAAAILLIRSAGRVR